MLDRDLLQHLLDSHGTCLRVVTAEVKGSAPREVGAAMVVWKGGQQGTIGGGTLEFEAAKAALGLLEDGVQSAVSRHPLGPALGQCCGGSVTLVSERIDQKFIDRLHDAQAYSRQVEGSSSEPFALKRDLGKARSGGQSVPAKLLDGWWVEPLYQAPRTLWIWGAGHVGRAIVDVLAPLPDFSITWIDTERSRFPVDIPDNVEWIAAKHPEILPQHAPEDAEHLILTFSHALDLALCHAILQRKFTFAGVIGSATKWARFRKRLADLGHRDEQILRISCPIGDPSLGKHPQAIAISVASKLLIDKADQHAHEELPGEKTA